MVQRKERVMILVRDIFQARYGKGGDVVALFKKAHERWPGAARYGQRVLADANDTCSGHVCDGSGKPEEEVLHEASHVAASFSHT
jgi:hypothetical protein